MNKDNITNSKPLYRIEDIQWGELAAINVFQEDLINEGQLERLLNGEKTDAIHLNIMYNGVVMALDATLQVIEQDNRPIIEIVGLTPADS